MGCLFAFCRKDASTSGGCSGRGTRTAYLHEQLQKVHGVTHVLNASGQQYEEGDYATYMRLVEIDDEPARPARPEP